MSEPEAADASKKGSAGNVLAAVVSLIIPGCGQLCQGRAGAGLLLFLLGGCLWIGTLGLLGWVANIIAAVEAAVWKGSSEPFKLYRPPRNQLDGYARFLVLLGIPFWILGMGGITMLARKGAAPPSQIQLVICFGAIGVFFIILIYAAVMQKRAKKLPEKIRE